MEIKDYIIYHSAGNLYWKDKQLKYLGCNANFAKIAGLNSPAEIIGKTDQDLFCDVLGVEELKKLAEIDNHVIYNDIDVVCEEVGITEKRETAFFLTKKCCLKNEKNNVIGLIGTSIDITKQKQSEIIRTEFISNMEHDIRTPITGIFGMMQILSEQENDLERKAILSEVASCAGELMNFCNDVVDFSKIQYRLSAAPVSAKAFELKRLIDSVIKIESIAAKDKALDLTLKFDPMLPSVVVGNSHYLKRILINLVSNAIKFTNKGFCKVSVILENKNIKPQDDIIVKFVVEDSGLGVPDDKKTLIYEQFTKVTPSNKGKNKGLGLGLNIVKQFVEALKGKIHLKSELGKGSTFIVLLPFKIPLSI